MMEFDDIGAAIYSLSIGEGRLQRTDDDSDDLMDIDSMEVPIEAEHAEHAEPHIEEYTEERDDEGNSLFLDSLNPTELGARYALMPRKLIEATPHNLSKASHNIPRASHNLPDHDYEFDTSDGNTTTRQRSVWSTHKRPDQRENLPTSGLSPIGGAGAFSNFLLGGSFGQIPASSSLQVHHHHYYSQDRKPTLANQSLSQNIFRRPANGSVSEREYDIPLPYTSSVASAPIRDCTPRTSEERMRSMLPLPWDSAAVPAEKTPYVLSSYLQLLINLFLSVYALHVIVSMIQAVRVDVAHKMDLEANNILVEIALCERSYRENNCSPDLIVPALEKMCARWARCMNQDPFKVGNRSLISAQTIGILLNSLIEPLSFKFLSVAAFMIIVVFACNFGFGYIRAKAYYGWSKQ